jgi:N-glycosidase YbiA
MPKRLILPVFLFFSAMAFASFNECIVALETAASVSEVEAIYDLFQAIPQPLTDSDLGSLRATLLHRARSSNPFREALLAVIGGYEGDYDRELPRMLVQLHTLAHEAEFASEEFIVWLLSLPTEPNPLHAMAVFRVFQNITGRRGMKQRWGPVKDEQEVANQVLSSLLAAIRAIDPKQLSLDVQCYQAAVRMKSALEAAKVWGDLERESETAILSTWARLIRAEISGRKMVPGDPTPIALQGYIARSLVWGSTKQKLASLQKLVGLEVSGEHKHVAMGKTFTERSRVAGVISSVQVAQGMPEGIFEMVLSSDQGGTRYRFSGTPSPSFPILETWHISDRDLGEEVAETTQFGSDLDILAIGLDMPAELVSYKNLLRATGTLAFDGSRSPFFEFSNSYEASIEIRGVTWPSSQHYFQAMKFKDTDLEHFNAILRASTPAAAEEMGREGSKRLRADWENVKESVMYDALLAKFTQHDHLKAVLLSTGNTGLIEHTERDRYGGDGEDGTGEGMLGRQLIKVRDALRAMQDPG